MEYASVGQVLEYRESGERLKVEVLEARNKPSSNGTLGEEYKLRLLEVLASSEPTPKVGLEFTVWRAKEGHPQFGSWYFKN